MRRLSRFGAAQLILLAGFWPSVTVLAQPTDLPAAAATTDKFPPGVRTITTPSGVVYADLTSRTLYGLDMRTVMRAGPDPALYCTGPCAADWEPLLAPATARPNIRYPVEYGGDPNLPAGFVQVPSAPDWTIIQGAAGPQWVYKGWHLVFVRKGGGAGSTRFDGAERQTWNTLKYIPPLPTFVAPSNVKVVWHTDAYALADAKGRLLFSGTCASNCSGWEPFAGGLASASVGQWQVSITGDGPQWTYRGQRVFVMSDAHSLPDNGKVLHP